MFYAQTVSGVIRDRKDFLTNIKSEIMCCILEVEVCALELCT